MKSQFKYFLLFFSFAFIASSCQKEEIEVEDELPPITQEGLNTFGCKIDGEVLVPKDGDPSLFVDSRDGLKASPRFINSDTMRYFFIQGVNAKDKTGDFVYLYFTNLNGIGSYELGNSTGSTIYQNNSPNHAIVISYDGETTGKRYLSFEGGGAS